MKFSVESVIINWKGVGTSPLMSIILAVLLLSVFISVSTIELALFWCLLINLNDSLINSLGASVNLFSYKLKVPQRFG